MDPRAIRFGGGAAQSAFNPLILVAVAIACGVVCFAPRRKATAAFLIAGLLVPIYQVLVVGGVHFPMLRLLAMAGFIRVLRERRPAKNWLFAGGFNRLDLSIILFLLMTAVNGVLLFREMGAFIYQVGNLITLMGTFLLLRVLIRDEEDVLHAIRVLAGIAAFVAVIMIYEARTGHNVYALLGGWHVAEPAHLMERDDRVRAEGPFGHPLLAGTCGAIMVPLFVGLWIRRKEYRLAVLGIVCGTVMVVTCNASTPVLGWAAGIGTLVIWPLRRFTRAMRWSVVGMLALAQLVMRHPVWHLITDIDVTGGSSSWHRYMLVNECILHFKDWLLVGVPSTASWGFDMWDTANQYVAICDSSGLIPFLLFMAILVYGFKYLARVRRASKGTPRRARFAWALTAALFANAVSFFGISYWDQTQVVWYALLVMISAMVATLRRQKAAAAKTSGAEKVRAPQPEAEELAALAG